MLITLLHNEREFKAALPEASQCNYLGKLLKSELYVEAFWFRT